MSLFKLGQAFLRHRAHSTPNLLKSAIQPLRCVYMSNNLEVPAHYETASERLSSVLGCSKQDSCAILMEYPEIKKCAGQRLHTTCNYLTKNLGVDKQLIMSFPWLLQFSKKILEEKVKLLSCLTKCAISSTVPLLQFDTEQLWKLFSNKLEDDQAYLLKKNCQDTQDRITFLANNLQCSELEVCNLISKYNFLMAVPIQRLDAVFELFRESKISSADLMRDAWILRYNPEQIKARLEIIQAVGMDNAKPWHTRSLEKSFQRSLEVHIKTEELLEKSKTKLEYIKNLLKLDSIEGSVDFARKNLFLIRAGSERLKNAFDTLLSLGYTIDDIKAVPRMLVCNCGTITYRFELLKEMLGVDKPSLNLIVLSNDKFNSFVRKLEMQKLTEAALRLPC
ncbi:transcription termination factor, mitochondrial [Cloeon dipterum]|uniref:transcription termination factor, mitochondrial n=1 Tax=Cloeon dipterum TaxID=197152 RepID=UPI0032204191